MLLTSTYGLPIVPKLLLIHVCNLLKDILKFVTILALNVKKNYHSKEFKKTVSFLKCNPFLQLTEYIGNENVYKPRVHGNTKHNTNSGYLRTAPSVIKEIGKKLESGTSVSNTYTNMVQKYNKSSVQGVLNPRNGEQVRNNKKANFEKSVNKQA